ncbi:malate dehydrogenase, NAD-dependent [Nadsonia fulvescens var. elongata DSM 6958]|uniref:malate dehydrogenase n=1 Tax=Nadsonia fulvescens var. elongata DSM 6958 TaxID=857566 RepID=A0A1E3PIQ8_9ASCO|nr:malate dehydrogenase, NAD-dependent [Nadsonia fulvescens var. elongata DSM 6958]
MVKAVVCGASGGIGQPLSLFLKASPYVTELALYDVVNAPGVAADLSHICTGAKVSGYSPKDDGLKLALTNAQLVVIPAGIPRKPGMTRDDLFKINAGIVYDLINGVAQFCPKAFVLVISNPVNSMVPIACEVLKRHKVFDPARVFGVTTLDTVRAQTFTASLLESTASNSKFDPSQIAVPVVGGHSGDTIVPLLSLAQPAQDLQLSSTISHQQRSDLIHRIQFGGDEVVQAKDGMGSATLSMAYAGYRFAEAVLRATVGGESSIVEASYVYLPGIPKGGVAVRDRVGLDYFAMPIRLGPHGVEEVVNLLDKIDEYEVGLINIAQKGLKTSIEKGVSFVTDHNAKI